MRILITGLVLLIGMGALPLVAQENADKIRRVLDGYRKAYGDFRVSEVLTSVTIRGEQIQGEQTYDFLLRKKEPDSMRYSLSHGSNSIVCGYDGKVGWQRVETGSVVTITELEDTALKALEREADFYGPLLRYFSRSEISIQLLDTAALEGRPVYQLEVFELGTPSLRYYLSMDSYRILRKDALGDDGEVVLETHYRNYRQIDGFPFPFEIENRRDGQRVSLTRVKEIEVNSGQLSFYFHKPTY